MTKRQPVDTDYVVYSKFLKEVGAEMWKTNHGTNAKDVNWIKQAEQMGLTAQECATVIIRNRKKRTALAANVASVEAALTVARSNLATAKAAEALATDKANALALREKLAKFVELGLVLDDCFVDFRTASLEMIKVLGDIHTLGQPAPTIQQFKVNADLAFKTAIQGTPFWSQDFPALGYGQKKTFKSLVEAWSSNIEANIAQRLQSKKEAA
jgi:hypothetical protein